MSDARARSRALIAPYLGKLVEANLDGGIFDHVPARFRFRFLDPGKLWSEIQEGYEDYLEDWDSKKLVPVAAVSSSPDYEFAWIFLDWRKKGDVPGVVVTTTDDWDGTRKLKSLAELKLEIGVDLPPPVDDEDDEDDEDEDEDEDD